MKHSPTASIRNTPQNRAITKLERKAIVHTGPIVAMSAPRSTAYNGRIETTKPIAAI